MELRDQLEGIDYFSLMGPRDLSQMVRLGGKHLLTTDLTCLDLISRNKVKFLFDTQSFIHSVFFLVCTY